MLDLRPNCECCNKDLPPEATDTTIGSFECTFCRYCAETTLGLPSFIADTGQPAVEAPRLVQVLYR